QLLGLGKRARGDRSDRAAELTAGVDHGLHVGHDEAKGVRRREDRRQVVLEGGGELRVALDDDLDGALGALSVEGGLALAARLALGVDVAAAGLEGGVALGSRALDLAAAAAARLGAAVDGGVALDLAAAGALARAGAFALACVIGRARALALADAL